MQKSALITGSAKRIGASIALFLAKEGYDIALHYNSSLDDAKILANRIIKLGRNCKIFKADLSEPQESEKLFLEVFKVFPNLCILINSASIFKKVNFINSQIEDLNNSLSIHLISPFILMQNFANKLEHGNIINIIDTKTSKPDLNRIPYSLGKNALLDLTKMAAIELAPNIRVNGISPGHVLLPSDGSKSTINIQELPLKKEVSFTDIHSSIKFILENNSLTGQIISVDCGENLLWQK